MKTPSKFFGLHAHSGFSIFDGLGYPQEHIDFCRENGLDGWSMTDHGHMNGFGHAYLHTEKLNKAGGNFKLIPGCEMYVHPDLDVWKLDYEINKTAKKGDKEALAILKKQREAIQTPLLAFVDEHDETLNVGLEGASLTVENEEETKSGKFYDPIKRRHHLVVLPKTSEGLQRLFHLVSRGYTEGFYRFPRVDYKMLKEAAKGGHLMVSTACIGGPLAYDVFQPLQETNFEDLIPSLFDDESLRNKILSKFEYSYDQLADAVGEENVMLELQFNKLPAQHLVNKAILEFARTRSLTDQLIVTCDSHYASPDHWKERELYKKLGWLNYQSFNPDNLPKSKEDLKCELYPKNAKQVWESYLETTEGHDFYEDSEIFDAIERTHDVAHEMIGEIHPDRKMKLPSYVVPKGQTANKALLEAAKAGLIKRGLANQPEYVDRMKTELKVIFDKNFSEYFLTMKAIIDLAREKMLAGPGRGSGAGSLVNYALYITDIDPVEYGLLFERFMSPERTEMPDIDTDIADRDELIKILRENFGNKNVIPISNYNTFKIKSLLKDVSRFYGIEFSEVNKTLASLERDVAQGRKADGVDAAFDISFEEAKKYSTKVSDYLEKYPQIADPINVLYKQNKALGRHAGGVIVSEKIEERMPLIVARGEMQTPWVEGMNYKHLEEFGWIKFDLLGLETLRIIERTISLVLQKSGVENPTFDQVVDWYNENIAPNVIDFNDSKVYKNVYHSGRWAGIFQCTQRGAQALFKRAKPESVVDLATLTSIYRPGPLSAKVDKLYIKAKNNPQNVFYGHPLIEQVLNSTYGMIIFQEQVMELCHVVAGFPKAECNKLRKMMKPVGSGNENVKKAAALKNKFVEGASQNGVDKNIASELYDRILYFSGYGFNKSHAVSYAVNSYHCAWLMTYYEQEWIQAYLEACSGNPKKLSKALSEVKALGYNIVPIDINKAGKAWSCVDDNSLMPSFLSCKGVGEAAVEEILEQRPYSSIEDLFWDEEGKWKHAKFNKRAIESLIKIRAFDSLDCVGPDKTFQSYSHMHTVLMENFNDIRKRTKKDPYRGKNNFIKALVESPRSEEWSFDALMNFEEELLGTINVEALLPKKFVKKMTEKNIHSLDDHNGREFYWFVLTKAIPKLTKNKKPYLLLNGIASTGRVHRMFCWGVPKDADLPPFTFCIAEVDKNDFGMSTKWNRIKKFSFNDLA